MAPLLKRFFLAAVLVVINLFVSAQTYDIVIDNRALTSNNTMEFDVFIKSNGATGNFALRSYQCGYQFNSAFVNSGTLSGAYVSGSSDLESTFGTTWGFSYNAANFVLNQSANTGSLCPGALIGTTARKIGRFRVTNTVNWGCADDNITIRTSGSGILTLALSKYNSLDCSDVTNTIISSGATASTSTPNESILTASSIAPPSCTGTTDVTVSASGGASPYTGTGVFTVGNGTYNYTVADSRGCTATTSIVVNITPITSSFNASGCSSYTLPWGTTVSTSGAYTNVYTSYQGCDSTVTANITIKSPSSSTTNQTICSTQLPYSWNGNSYTAAGIYSTTLTNAVGCDSVATLVLNTQTASLSPTSISSTSFSVTAGSPVTLTVNGGSLGTGASWIWYTGSCGSGASVGTGSPFTVTPSATTTYFARAENACGTTSCVNITISVTAPSCTPSGITSSVSGNIMCNNKTAVLTVQGTLSSGGTWKWYRTTCGGSSTAGTGSTISVSPTRTTTYFVRQEGGTCGTSGCASITITVITKPGTPGIITGQTTGLCNATNISYSIAPVASATSYTWYVPAGSTVVSGQGTNSIIVNFGTTLSTTSLCVTASNQCGTSANRCLTIGLKPQISGSISGPTSLVTGTNGTFSATSFGATSFFWQVPSGWTILSGQGTSSIVAKAVSTSGYVRVTPGSTCGSGTTKSLSVRVTSARPGETIENAEPEITVWPVPARDVLFFKHNGVQPRRMEMFDSYGRMVMADGWITRLNLSNYASGVYFLKIYTRSGKVQTKRIEIVK